MVACNEPSHMLTYCRSLDVDFQEKAALSTVYLADDVTALIIQRGERTDCIVGMDHLAAIASAGTTINQINANFHVRRMVVVIRSYLITLLLALGPGPLCQLVC